MKLKDLLNEYKQRQNVTSDYIAKQVGVNKSTVSRWLQSDTNIKVMKPDVIEKLSFLLGVDIESLIKDAERYEKPILGYAKAGYGLFLQENFIGYEQVSKSDFYRGDFFLQVVGDSMIGAHIHDQDLIYIKRCDDVASGTIAVVSVGDDEVTVKRIIKKENLLILEAANPSVTARYFTIDEVETLPVTILGKVLYSRYDLV